MNLAAGKDKALIQDGGGQEVDSTSPAKARELLDSTAIDYRDLGLQLRKDYRKHWLLRASVGGALGSFLFVFSFVLDSPLLHGLWMGLSLAGTLFWLASSQESMRHLLHTGVQPGPGEILRSLRVAASRTSRFTLLLIVLYAATLGVATASSIAFGTWGPGAHIVSAILATLPLLLAVVWFHGTTDLLLREEAERPSTLTALAAAPLLAFRSVRYIHSSKHNTPGFLEDMSLQFGMANPFPFYIGLALLPLVSFLLTVFAGTMLVGKGTAAFVVIFPISFAAAFFAADSLLMRWSLRILSFQARERRWQALSCSQPKETSPLLVTLPNPHWDALAMVQDTIRRDPTNLVLWVRTLFWKNRSYWLMRACVTVIAVPATVFLVTLAQQFWIGSPLLFGFLVLGVLLPPLALWMGSGLEAARDQLEGHRSLALHRLPDHLLRCFMPTLRVLTLFLTPAFLLLGSGAVGVFPTGLSGLFLGLGAAAAIVGAWCWLTVLTRLRVSRPRSLGEILRDLPATFWRMLYFPRNSLGRPEPGLLRGPTEVFFSAIHTGLFTGIITAFLIQTLVGPGTLTPMIAFPVGCFFASLSQDYTLGVWAASILALEVERHHWLGEAIPCLPDPLTEEDPRLQTDSRPAKEILSDNDLPPEGFSP
jgi:hypothetical protein